MESKELSESQMALKRAIDSIDAELTQRNRNDDSMDSNTTGIRQGLIIAKQIVQTQFPEDEDEEEFDDDDHE